MLDNLRGRVVLGLREQDADMVAHGIDFDEGRIEVLEDASDVGVELSTFFITEQGTAVFRAEHEVNNDVGEGLGHTGVTLAWPG